ncbi:MAG: hypothetical protein ACI4KF_03990 [Huintestinicola sp.]
MNPQNMRYVPPGGNGYYPYGRGFRTGQQDQSNAPKPQPAEGIPSPPPQSCPCSEQPRCQHRQNDLGRLLGSIALDEEKLLILILILIVAKEGGDIALLAALAYLLF